MAAMHLSPWYVIHSPCHPLPSPAQKEDQEQLFSLLLRENFKLERTKGEKGSTLASIWYLLLFCLDLQQQQQQTKQKRREKEKEQAFSNSMCSRVSLLFI